MNPGPQQYETLVPKHRTGKTLAIMGARPKKPRLGALDNKLPGVGAYNILKSYDAFSPSSIKAAFPKSVRHMGMGNSSHRKKRFPGPTDYKVVEAVYKNSPRASIGKSERDPFERRTRNRAKKEPGPGTYDPSASFSSTESMNNTQVTFPKE